MTDERLAEIRAARHERTDFKPGERLLYRPPDRSWDTPVIFRAAEPPDALVILPAREHSTIVLLAHLRRGVLAR